MEHSISFIDRKATTSQQHALPVNAEWSVDSVAALFELPCVAIGGITPENGRALVDAGADFLAVCSGVWEHPAGPAAAVKAFLPMLES